MLQQAITNPASAEEARNQQPGVPTKWKAGAHCRFADDPDAALVSSFRAGEALAFDILVRRHERRLLNVAMRITKNHEDAEDVVQDSFLSVFKHLDSFRGNSRFVTWLTRITINQALMSVRGRTRNVTSLDQHYKGEAGEIVREIQDCGSTPEQLYSQREFESLLLKGTAGMEESAKLVLELRINKECSERELAQVMGLTQSAAKTRLFRARRELRKRMEPHLCPANSTRTVQVNKKRCSEMPDTNHRESADDACCGWLAASSHTTDSFSHAQVAG